MTDTVLEYRFDCPHCAAPISMLLDLSAGAQDYIEDCEVCCRPIAVRYAPGAAGELEFVEVEQAG